MVGQSGFLQAHQPWSQNGAAAWARVDLGDYLEAISSDRVWVASAIFWQ
jgi:hypothetical protein